MEKILKVFRTILTTILCIMTAMDVIVIVLQVLFRFIFHISRARVSELAGVSLVWITFLGASLATLDESNINFNGLIDKATGLGKFLLKLLVNCLILFMIYIMIRYGYKSMRIGLNTKMVALPTTMAVCVSVIPISGVFMGLAVLLNIYKDYRTYRGLKAIGEDTAAIYDDVPEEVMEKANASIGEADKEGTKT